MDNEELVEKMARAIFERRGWWKDDPRSWERMRQDLREQYMNDARAALRVVKDSGLKIIPARLDHVIDRYRIPPALKQESERLRRLGVKQQARMKHLNIPATPVYSYAGKKLNDMTKSELKRLVIKLNHELWEEERITHIGKEPNEQLTELEFIPTADQTVYPVRVTLPSLEWKKIK